MWKLMVLLLQILSSKVLAQREVTCYYRNWVQHSKGKAKFLPENIDGSLCTVIKYAFLRINESTNVLETTQENDGEMLGKINDLKKVYPSLKIQIAIGGWNHENKARFSTMARNKMTRKIFIYSVVEFLKKHDLDGVSIDWLYPGIRPKNSSAGDKMKFTRLLKEMLAEFEADSRRRKTKRFLLSATVSSSVKKIHKSYEIYNVARYVDSVDVMVNSLWGHWKQRTGSNTAMKGETPTVIESIEAWLGAGMPARKINVGFALYGRSFKLKSASDHELGAPTLGPGKPGNHTKKAGILAYYEICSQRWSHQTKWYDSETEAPYASAGNLWVGYDSPSSLRYKINRLFQRYNLRGVTLWALDYDDFTGSFCNAEKYPMTREVKMALSKATLPSVVTCQVKLDVAFILDSSGSLRSNYQREKDFLKEIARKIGISEDGSRAGVITFSHSPEHSIKLNDYYDILSFNAAVDDIPYMGYTTRIDRALRLTQVNMFTTKNGARPGIPKFLILLTDGTQTKYTDAEDPSKIGEELRKTGIVIFTIGIGKGINKTELIEVAGSKDKSFDATTFSELSGRNFVKDIGDAICSAAAMAPIISCQRKMDVGFILDSSGSLQNDYDNEKYFLKAIASSFGISKDGTRAGVITFSYYAENSIKLNDHFDISTFNVAVDDIPLMGYTTRIDKALQLAQNEMFTENNGARNNVPKVLIFLTDGSQTQDIDAVHPGDIADELRKAGVHIVVVGIGKGTNITELQHLAGDPKRVFFVPSFKELIQSDFMRDVKLSSCSIAGESIRKRVTPGSNMLSMTGPNPNQPICKTVSDIGFILDSSGSLKNEYMREKEFLKEVAAYFGISQNGFHAGVITFSFNAVHSIRLDEHSTLDSFNEAVDQIPHMGFTTRIDLALRLAQQNMFSEERGGRIGKNKILILLTDGTQTNDPGAEEPGEVADELRDSGINIFTVGIGSGIHEKELVHIAGGQKNAFTTASFKDLLETDLVTRLGKAVCPDDKLARIEYNTCQDNVDIGFVVDSSGSLRNDYDKEKYFMKSIASSFGLSKDGSRAGVVTFSYSAIHSIKLNEYFHSESFNAAVDQIPLMGYTTRIDRGLRLAHKDMFKLRNGARSDVRKLLILLTDGSQTKGIDAENPATIAKEIRRSGVELIVVGVGKGVNVTELSHISGNSKNLYITSSFNELVGEEFTDKFRNKTCVTKRVMNGVIQSKVLPSSFSTNDAETILAKVPPRCQSILDFGFILDSSGSLRNDYVKEKYFLKTLADYIGVSEKYSRASVITFSFFAKLSIKMNDHYNINSFSASVDAIPFMGYTTMIDRALRLALKDMFTKGNGARYGVPKILILMTDGTQTTHQDAEDPILVAREIREAGIKLFVIGIGKGIDRDELVSIAGSKENVFIASSFSKLIGEKFMKKIKDVTCAIGIDKVLYERDEKDEMKDQSDADTKTLMKNVVIEKAPATKLPEVINRPMQTKRLPTTTIISRRTATSNRTMTRLATKRLGTKKVLKRQPGETSAKPAATATMTSTKSVLKKVATKPLRKILLQNKVEKTKRVNEKLTKEKLIKTTKPVTEKRNAEKLMKTEIARTTAKHSRTKTTTKKPVDAKVMRRKQATTIAKASSKEVATMKIEPDTTTTKATTTKTPTTKPLTEQQETTVKAPFKVDKNELRVQKTQKSKIGIPAKQAAPPVKRMSKARGLGMLNNRRRRKNRKLTCPLDKDINAMQLMVDSRVKSTIIAKYFHESHILPEMLKYFHHLKLLMTFLSSKIPNFKTTVVNKIDNVLTDSIEGSCRAFETESVLSRIFTDVPGEDLFTATRLHGGEYFVDLLWASGLASEILKSGEYIFIVPVDRAFKKLPKILRKRLMDPSYLKRVMQFHISKIDQTKNPKSPDQKSMLSLDGKTKIFYNTLKSIQVFTGSLVLKQRIRARNGIIWMVDSLMLPPQNKITSIVQTASHLKVLDRALSDPFILKELESLDSFTIFAPSDEAFERYTNSKYHTITGPYTLRALVRGHIIPGTYFTSIFDYSVTYRLKALDNSIVFVQKIDDTMLVINNGVIVRQINIHGTDGVLHIIDGVITSNAINIQ